MDPLLLQHIPQDLVNIVMNYNNVQEFEIHLRRSKSSPKYNLDIHISRLIGNFNNKPIPGYVVIKFATHNKTKSTIVNIGNTMVLIKDIRKQFRSKNGTYMFQCDMYDLLKPNTQYPIDIISYHIIKSIFTIFRPLVERY